MPVQGLPYLQRYIRLDISEPLTLIQMVIQRRGNTRADLLLHWQADFDTKVTDEVAENRVFDMYELGAQP